MPAGTMLDWLLRPAAEAATVEVDGRRLPVTIRRLARARRITLRLAPDGSEVRVSMPRHARTADALAFARSQAEWLERQAAAIPPHAPPVPGGTLAFRGERLRIAHDATAPRRPVLDDGAIVLGGPEHLVATRLRRWLEDEARALMAGDLAFYCARAGLPTPALALSNARRRWGSCAPDGSIRINWRLVMAPDFVRRAVVAHEVAHLVHFDHSPRFHALLAELYEGEVREADRWLKREGRGLHATFG